MEHRLNRKASYLGLPIKMEASVSGGIAMNANAYEESMKGEKKTLLEIFVDGEKLYELMVLDFSGESCDYYCWLPLPADGEDGSVKKESMITLKGDLSREYLAEVRQAEKPEYPQVTRPLLHFTAARGWLNDPNGLVYQNGVYHLYFQYNPAGTEWGNLSWGHAVSTDLLTFRQMDAVLYPDDTGTVYSGSGIVNEHGLTGFPKDALLFFYTAAGGSNLWSRGRAFTQRMAVSTDDGKTLKKIPGEVAGAIGQESRDPQVFWHEPSKGYVMTLWIQGEEIGLLRSEDLRKWEMTDRFSLPGAYECPNLFCLPMPDSGASAGQWVLSVADGSYYFGSFDGYHFVSDGVRRKSYLNGLPYAAQVYNGVSGRTVLIAWLRTKNRGKLYTGMMGLPRELGLVRRNGSLTLQMRLVREYRQSKCRLTIPDTGEATAEDGVTVRIIEEAVTELVLVPEPDRNLTVDFWGNTLTVMTDDQMVFRRKKAEHEKQSAGCTICADHEVCRDETEERTPLPEPYSKLHLLIDRQVIEVSGNDYTQTAYYETGSDTLRGTIRVTGCMGMPEIFQWKPTAGVWKSD